MSTLLERIAEARVHVAKTACTSPHIYPQYSRLLTAKSNLAKAIAEEKAARAAWEALTADAPKAYKKLAPRV